MSARLARCCLLALTISSFAAAQSANNPPTLAPVEVVGQSFHFTSSFPFYAYVPYGYRWDTSNSDWAYDWLFSDHPNEPAPPTNVPEPPAPANSCAGLRNTWGLHNCSALGGNFDFINVGEEFVDRAYTNGGWVDNYDAAFQIRNMINMGASIEWALDFASKPTPCTSIALDTYRELVESGVSTQSAWSSYEAVLSNCYDAFAPGVHSLRNALYGGVYARAQGIAICREAANKISTYCSNP